jgi:hypothetical protein
VSRNFCRYEDEDTEGRTEVKKKEKEKRVMVGKNNKDKRSAYVFIMRLIEDSSTSLVYLARSTCLL